MSFYVVEKSSSLIFEEAVIVDTNVLVDAFSPDGEYYENARAFLDLYAKEQQIIIVLPVIIEAWGMMVGSKKRLDAGVGMLEWVSDPANCIVLPEDRAIHAIAVKLRNRCRVDIVDAWLFATYERIKTHCKNTKLLTVATRDQRDFYNVVGKLRYAIRVVDPLTLEITNG